MKISGIKIDSFKRLKRESLKDIQDKNVYLIGGNKTGKTSFLDAIWFGLTGKNAPTEPIHNNGKKGLIEIDLIDDDGSEFTARTKLKNNRPFEFEVENKNFKDKASQFVKSPRKFIESRIGMIDFEIGAFFSKSNSEQIKYLGKYLKLDVSDIDSEIEEISESRKFDKKSLKEAELAVNYYDDKKAEQEYYKLPELMLDRDYKKSSRSDMARTLFGIRERRAKISELQTQINTLKQEEEAGILWVNANRSLVSSKKDANEAHQKVLDCEILNAEIREAKEAKQADEKCDKLRTAIETATDEIEEQRLLKAERISEGLSVEGLTYDVDKECLLFEGLPFDAHQTNTATQLIVGMKLAYSMLGDLKILKVDASLIDKVEFDKVLEWADKNEINLFVELVDREATQLKIVTDD